MRAVAVLAVLVLGDDHQGLEAADLLHLEGGELILAVMLDGVFIGVTLDIGHLVRDRVEMRAGDPQTVERLVGPEAVVGEVGEIIAGHIHDLDPKTAHGGIIGNQTAEEQQLVVIVGREEKNVRPVTLVQSAPGLHRGGQIAIGIGIDVPDHDLVIIRQKKLKLCGGLIERDVFVQKAVLPAALARLIG